MRFPASTTQLVLWALFAFLVNAASADTASRLYQQGNYREALARYQHAAEKEKENWPLFYDLGAAAYKAGRLDDAAKAFERTIASPDPTLRAKSLYNLGNSLFRIGEAAERKLPQQAMPIYERSLKSYENALTIDPADADAKYNREVVKKKIEQLKQQQQQQESKPQPNKDQEKDKDKQDHNRPDNQSSKQERPNQPQPQKPEEKQKQEQQNQQKQPSQAKSNEEHGGQNATQGQNDDSDKLEAQMLLDNLRESERNWNFYPELLMKNLKEAGPPDKDW